MIKRVNVLFHVVYVIDDLNGEEIVGTFYQKEFQKANQTVFRVIERGDKLSVK